MDSVTLIRTSTQQCSGYRLPRLCSRGCKSRHHQVM